jgi:phenylpropionate dioxygenase-like ring-hydroxylating dioxygenase large terminal subunit
MTSVVDSPRLADCWHVVAEGADVAAAPVAVTLLSRDYVLWRAPGGEIVAAPDRCPHREAPLSLGHVEDGRLVCSYHGWTFGDGGRCVEVPSASAGVPIPPKAHLSAIGVEERYGLVWLCPGTPAQKIPAMRWDDDPAFRRINSGVDMWTTSTLRMTDNFLDISHFPYVHTGTFGIAANKQVPKFEIVPLDEDFTGYEYEVEVANDRGQTASGLDAAVITRRMTTGFALPFTVRSTIHYETGLDHIILLCSTPIDDTRSYFTFVVWRNDDHSVPAEDVIAFDRAIGAEDKRMLERVPGVLPIDATGTVSVQADRASVEWRRRLAAALAVGPSAT